MKKVMTALLALAGLAVAAAGGYWLGHRGSAPAGESAQASGAEVKPVATVQVTPIVRRQISQWVTAYGSIIAPPSEVSVISVPFESRVTKVLVAPGQVVSAGQPLIEVEGSAATALAVQEARNAAAAADRDLQLVQQQFEQKLATNSALATAQSAQLAAQARLRALEQGGAGGPRELKAEAPGVVSKVDVQLGQVVPVGGPLVEIAGRNHIEATLGVEPQDARTLRLGQAVELRPVGAADSDLTAGSIQLIGQQVDPMTRLVPVLASLPSGSKLMLDEFVTARLAVASADALVVPRNSVLPSEEGGYELFTVQDGKAVKHDVKLGIQTDQQSQVIAPELKAGEPVVVVGNAELEDGMSVRVSGEIAPASAEPAGAASRPASQPAEPTSRPSEGGL